jgi:hypothetical protein
MFLASQAVGSPALATFQKPFQIGPLQTAEFTLRKPCGFAVPKSDVFGATLGKRDFISVCANEGIIQRDARVH